MTSKPTFRNYFLLNKNTLNVTLSDRDIEMYFQFSHDKKPVMSWELDDKILVKSGTENDKLTKGPLLTVLKKEGNILSIGLPRNPSNPLVLDLDKIPSRGNFCGIC